jgi:biotin transport system substrate-specific component
LPHGHCSFAAVRIDNGKIFTQGRFYMTATLATRLWPQAQDSNLVRNVVLAVAGTVVVAIAAHISVVQLPVPLTLQTLAVLAIGCAFGARLGAATLALYAAEGAAGLPVFSPTPDGYPGIMGPTGGYILGFILAAGLVGWFADKGWDRSMPKLLVAMLLGAAVLYVPGLAWLSTFVGGMGKAVEYGLTPFWLADIVKAVIAAVAFPAVWSLLGVRK